MNENVIAIIKLAPGNVGWYDRLTSIHLTVSNPTAEVKAGMNLLNIKKAIKYRTISVINGNLEEENLVSSVTAEPKILSQVMEQDEVKEEPELKTESDEVKEEPELKTESDEQSQNVSNPETENRPKKSKKNKKSKEDQSENQ